MAGAEFDPTKPFRTVDDEVEFDPSKPFTASGVQAPQVTDAAPDEDKSFFRSLLQGLDRLTLAESSREFIKGTAEEGLGRGAAGAAGVFFKPLGAGATGEEAARPLLESLGHDPEERVRITPRDVGVGASMGISTPVDRGEGLTKAQVLGTFLDVFAGPSSAAAIPKGLAGATKLGAKGIVGAADIGTKGIGKIPVVGPPTEAIARAGAAGARAGLGSLRGATIKIADDYPRLTEIQKKFGIEGEPTLELEFGIDTAPGRMGQRRRLDNEVGEADKFKKLANETEDAIDRQITTIGGGTPPRTTVEAGEEIIEALNGAKEQVFKGIDQTFSDIKDFSKLAISDLRNPNFPDQLTPRDKLLKSLRGFEKQAKKEIRLDLDATLVSEAKDLLKKVEASRKSVGSFRQTLDVWRKIGKAAFRKPKPGVQIAPTDQKAIQKLYFDIGDAMIETVRRDVPNGEALARRIQENNETLSKFFSQASRLQKSLKNKDSGEQVFRAIAMGNTETARDALSVLAQSSPETIDVVRGALMKSLKKERFLTPDSPSFQNFANNIGNNIEKVSNWLTREELQDFRDLIDFSLRIGSRAQAPGLARSGFFNRNALIRALDAGIEEFAVAARAGLQRGAKPPKPSRTRGIPTRVTRGVEIGTRPEEEARGLQPPQRIGR